MNLDWSRAAVLSRLEFLACWDAIGSAEPVPVALRIAEVGRTVDERARLLAGALDGLRTRGLAGPDGLPCPPLAGALRLLARPDHLLDLHVGDPGGTVVGLGAVAGELGVVVAAAGDTLRILPVSGYAVADVVVGLAGPITAGVGRPVNVPADLLAEAQASTGAPAGAGSLWDLADALRSRGVPKGDASSLARMCGDVRTVGQLGVTYLVEGVPRRGPWIIGFHRAGDGWFCVLRRPSRGGMTVQVAPVDAERLRRHLRELLDRVPVPA